MGAAAGKLNDAADQVLEKGLDLALDLIPFYGTYRVCSRGDKLGCAMSIAGDLLLTAKALKVLKLTGLFEKAAASETSRLLTNALKPFKGGSLTQAGRSLTKHPEVLGYTKQTLRQILRTEAEINAAAASALGDILKGAETTLKLPRYGAILEFRGTTGFGARFYADTGEFIGFINPDL